MIHVVLFEPEIHWNTGNAGRTCLAAGAQLHLVEPLGFSLDEREVRRAGLDYWQYVKPVIWESWEQLEAELPRLGAPWFFSTKAERPLWDASFEEEVVLVFGPETRGLPPHFFERWPDRFVTIPQLHPAVRSLNLSTAVGVATYEVMRQQRAALR
jgi:tRNA (cytidine/uridine-2'-O-)-methyltransferase